MRASKLVSTLALSALLITGCGFKGQNAIMTINDKPITQARYDKLIDQAIVQSPFGKMGDLKGNKDGFLYLMTEQRVVNQLIIEELLNQEADARGITVSNADVDSALQKIMEQMGGKDQLAQILRQNGVSAGDFKKDVRRQVKMQKLANAAGNIEVTDKECETFYKNNPEKFNYPEQVRASHILIAANPYQIQEELKEKSKKELSKEDIIAQVEAKIAEKEALANKIAENLKVDSSKFAQLAKKYSEDPGSAKQGGDLGFFPEKQMVPEFAKAAFEAKPETIVGPVKTQFGYHIIIVKDRKEAGVTTFEQAKSDIKDFLTTERQIKALDDLTQAAKKKAEIKYMDERYNPDEIQKKLHFQMDGFTGGQASKVRNESKK